MNRQHNRTITFDVVDDFLVRTVQREGGKTYIQRCAKDNYREIAFGIEERAVGGVTMETLAHDLGLPYTQVNVALEFLKERGCVEVRRRRTFPASGALYEDAMIEWHVLAGD